MLELFTWLVHPPTQLPSMPTISWQQATVFSLPVEGDPQVEQIVQEYLQKLSSRGIDKNLQGVWIQTQWSFLSDNSARKSLPAASLTKIATTIAAIEKWGLQHRFSTKIYSDGVIDNGVLKGDLVVEGGGDPFFVWENAMMLGNRLAALGIKKVSGKLVVVGDFAMNFKLDRSQSAELLLRGVDYHLWDKEASQQYNTLPKDTPRPDILISGGTEVRSALPQNLQLLVDHQSVPLQEILKQMNIYSNNYIAQMLADSIGDAQSISQLAAAAAKVPPQEITLINGSGLGEDNRISPRAVSAMLMELEERLKPQSLGVKDLFPLAGRDKVGTMQWRSIPQGVAIKTGTLNRVSALAGVIPTKERGQVWFTIINYGNNNIEYLRSQQDVLLQQLAKHWTIVPDL